MMLTLLDFQASNNINGTFYVMNNGTHLFILVRIDETVSSTATLQIIFDNDNDGVEWELDDDSLFYGHNYPSSPGFKDQFKGEGWDPDVSQHGSGGFSQDSDYRYFELSHPLSSGDPYDFDLSSGDIVGFQLVIWASGYPSEGYWPSSTNQIIIVSRSRRYAPLEVLVNCSVEFEEGYMDHEITGAFVLGYWDGGGFNVLGSIPLDPPLQSGSVIIREANPQPAPYPRPEDIQYFLDEIKVNPIPVPMPDPGTFFLSLVGEANPQPSPEPIPPFTECTVYAFQDTDYLGRELDGMPRIDMATDLPATFSGSFYIIDFASPGELVATAQYTATVQPLPVGGKIIQRDSSDQLLRLIPIAITIIGLYAITYIKTKEN